jgi:hypothetical protein
VRAEETFIPQSTRAISFSRALGSDIRAPEFGMRAARERAWNRLLHLIHSQATFCKSQGLNLAAHTRESAISDEDVCHEPN